MVLVLPILTTLSCLALVISLSNLLVMRSLSQNPATEDLKFSTNHDVAILIPMRNEEFNAASVIESALASRGLSNVELLALNDNSTDSTRDILEGYAWRIKVLQGDKLPQGWLGKPYACLQLAQNSSQEYLVFLDADVRLSPSAISSAIDLMQSLEWDFISPYPAQHGKTLLMKLIQPLLQWSWLTSVPLRLAESGKWPSMIIANGQFFIVKRSAYFAIAGHEAVKDEVLEDLALARKLTEYGFKGGVAEASKVANCTMYESNSQLISGYTKSLWKAFGGPLGSLFTIALLILTQVLPSILLLAGVATAALPFALVALTHLVAATRSKSPIYNILFHPISALILIYLICESYRRKSLGQLEWRGRRVI